LSGQARLSGRAKPDFLTAAAGEAALQVYRGDTCTANKAAVEFAALDEASNKKIIDNPASLGHLPRDREPCATDNELRAIGQAIDVLYCPVVDKWVRQRTPVIARSTGFNLLSSSSSVT
jgi:hypothetical protein